MKKILIIGLIAVFSFLGQALAQMNTDTILTQEKKTNILKFMHNIKSDEMHNTTFDNIIKPYQQGMAAVPQTYWEKLKAQFENDSLSEKMINVYNRYFSRKDLVEMNKFFDSEVGKKFMSTIPAATNECWELVDKWAIETSQKVKDKLMQDGYLNVQK